MLPNLCFLPSQLRLNSDPFADFVVLDVIMQGVAGSTTFTDLKGHAITNNNGVAVNGAGTAAIFNGTNQYLSLADSDDWEPGAGELTGEAWVYNTAITRHEFLSHWGGNISTRNGWSFGMMPSGRLIVSYRTTGDYNLIGSSVSVPLNELCHVAFSIDSNRNLRLFVNGVLDSNTVNITSSSINNAAYNLTIGVVNPEYDGGYFPGNYYRARLTKACRYTASFTPEYMTDTSLLPTGVAHSLAEPNGLHALACVALGSDLWVARYRTDTASATLFKVNPVTETVITQYGVADYLHRLITDGTNLYAISFNGKCYGNLQSGSGWETAIGTNPASIEYLSGHIYIAIAAGTLYKLTTAGSIVTSVSLGYGSPDHITTDGTDIFAACSSGRIVRVNQSMSVVDSWAASNIVGIVAVGDYLYYSNSSGVLTKSTKTGTVVATASGIGDSTVQYYSDLSAIGVCNSTGGYKFLDTSLNVLRSLSTASDPRKGTHIGSKFILGGVGRAQFEVWG